MDSFQHEGAQPIEANAHEENIAFVKSWNEWGEGNYLEPDLQFGKQYIRATREALDIVE